MATTDPGWIDPASAQNAEVFVMLLSQVRSATELSLWEIEEQARQAGYDLDPATLARALSGSDLPGEYLVTGLLLACGLSDAQIDRWLQVREELAATAPDPLAPESMVPPSGRGRRRADVPRRPLGKVLIGVATAGALILAGFLVTGFWPDTPMISGQPPNTPSPGSPDASATGEPSPTQAPESSAPTAGTSPSGNPVLRSGSVTLASGQGIDLDTGLGSGGLDLEAISGGIRSGDNGKRLELMPSQPSKQNCAGLGNGQLGRSLTVNPGSWLCVRTTEGRWARVGVTATTPSLVLSYIVWT